MNQPNILFIMADDLGWGDISLHDSLIQTPNIDRMAAQGTELKRHYVCPMCTPTRASLLTGRYPGRFGPHATTPSNDPVLPDSYPTLATVLRAGGYSTGLFGKWHLGSDTRFAPNNFGFDYSYGSLAGGVDPYNHCYKKKTPQFTRTWHRNGELIDEPGHATDLITEEAINWINRQKSPWFCYVPYTAVHVPVKAPHPWIDQYEGKTYDDDPARDRSFKRYAGYTSHMDHGVGDLIDNLRERNLLEDTIIVFTSDNGALYECLHESDQYPGYQEIEVRLGSNKPFRGQKAQMYEGGILTPTLIQWCGHIEPRGTVEEPLSIADWMPTFTRLAGANPPGEPMWDGMDIWPQITGERTPEEKRTLFWNFKSGTQYALRDGDWKLIRIESEEEMTFELFNIAEDPYEENECSAQYPEKVDELEKMILKEAEMDDTSCRPEL